MSTISVMFTSGSSAQPTSDRNGSSGVPIRSKPALQNAETAWNTPIAMPFPNPYSGTNRQDSSTAPAPSMVNVPSSTRRVRRTMPPPSDRLKPALITMRSCSVNVRRSANEAMEAMVIKPSPPIWMSSRMTHLPNTDQ